MKRLILLTGILGLTLLSGCSVHIGTGSTDPTPVSADTPAASPSEGDEENAGDLKVTDFHFSTSKTGEANEEKKFQATDHVWLLFAVEGFKTADDKSVWVQEDLTVLNPNGEPILQRENLIDLKDKNPNNETRISFNNDVTLPEKAPSGTYKVNMTLRDKEGNQTAQFEETFDVE